MAVILVTKNIKNMNPESILKGRMAETLFEELIKRSGNVVYRFGYEAIVQNLVQLEESFNRYNEVGERLRAMPDFIVIDKRGEPRFVEVKFRWNPDEPLYDDTIDILRRVEKFWNATLVFVNCRKQPYFRVSNPPYIKNKKLISSPLTEEKNWKIDKKVYDEFETLVHRYLTPTLIPHKK